MNRINIVEYVKLAEVLRDAKYEIGNKSGNGEGIWWALMSLSSEMEKFIKEDNGFSTSKHVAESLHKKSASWTDSYWTNVNDDQEVLKDLFHNMTINEIVSDIDRFRTVFEVESLDVYMFSIGQLSIYQTASLVLSAESLIPREFHKYMTNEILSEFNNAGKCLAFNLGTACGFHCLRGIELIISKYLEHFNIKVDKLRSWNDYIKSMEKLISDDNTAHKPSAKVAAMLDRIRSLERNPLMHPRDKMNQTEADMLLHLCVVTAVEMCKDMRDKK